MASSSTGRAARRFHGRSTCRCAPPCCRARCAPARACRRRASWRRNSACNFINALHDGLIKNSGAQRFDHLALAEKFEFVEDAESCTFTLRPGLRFHDGSPLTSQDVKWSFEHYRGAWAKVLHDKTARIEVPDDRTVRFVFNAPFLDFPILMG